MKKLLSLLLLTFFVFVALCDVAAADMGPFVAIGPIEGNVCTGFVIEVCGFEKIDATKDGQGKISPLNMKFDQVEKFKPTDATGVVGLCYFYETQRLPMYQSQDNGSYKRIKADYIVFKCRKIK